MGSEMCIRDRYWITQQTEQALQKQQIDYQHIKITPAPLNTLLWRIVVIDEEVYYEGFRSIFDGDTAFSFTQFERGMELKKLLPDQTYIKRINWFTQDNFKLEQQDNMIVATDLRMGMECNYVFNFVVGQKNDSEVSIGNFEKISQRPNLNNLHKIWDRIWQPNVSLASPSAKNDCNSE